MYAGGLEYDLAGKYKEFKAFWGGLAHRGGRAKQVTVSIYCDEQKY